MDTKEQWGAMICDTCPLSKKEYLTAADIVKYPIMLPSRDSIKNELINWFGDMAEKLNISATFNLSYNSGINYFDLAAGDGPAFTYFGKAIGDVRKNIFYQVHFCANYETGTYGKTASVDTMHRSLPQMRKRRHGHYRYEAVFGRPAFGREGVALRQIAHPLPVHTVRP